MPDEVMSREAASAYCRKSISSLNRATAEGLLVPRRSRVRTVYLKSDLDRWLSQLDAAKTNDAPTDGSISTSAEPAAATN